WGVWAKANGPDPSPMQTASNARRRIAARRLTDMPASAGYPPFLRAADLGLAAALAFGFAAALAARAGLAAAGVFAAFSVLRPAARCGRGEPPDFDERAASNSTASSSVTLSGVLSDGSVALTPLWLTYGPDGAFFTP